MEVIISIVGSLSTKASEYAVDPIARQLGYLFKPRTKFLNLRSKVEDLKNARERVQQSVNSATRKGEVIFDDVQRWLTVVDEKISEEAETQLQDDEDKATKRCFAGFCPDFKFSYPLSKKADKEANAIAQLLTQKDTFDGVSRPSDPKGMDTIRSVEEYEAFESRRGAFDGVMEALKDDSVSTIGVYGMGGVGKTTLVKEAFKQAKEEQLFNEVILVAINQTPNMLNIQKEIAEKLGLAIQEDNMDMRATRLRERLKKEERVLVILDDIWESLDLRALGIPSVSEHKGCKILMTSRMLDVLISMDSHPNISIETLKEDEAWNLFKRMAGSIVERSDLQSTAVEVAKRCAGLPIAIATIAKALKPKENLFEWRDALRQLSKPSKRNFKGIPAQAYSAIELSYKFLEGEELQPVFLLCSIMGHNADVEDLLRYVIGLGFIHDVNTMEESRDRVLTLVNNLKASSLLLKGSHPNNFDIHDVVRDVAQSIASRDLHWLALFSDWPDEKTMNESQLISLQNVKVSELFHQQLGCPNLKYFSIGMKNHPSLKIATNFFEGMRRLKVLEFNNINLTSLPSSIGFLKSLCTLRLRDCSLEDIAILGELGNLEILDLHGSTMRMLPNEIGQLTKLKLLDLGNCFYLDVISPNVLSKLSILEELYLYDIFDRFEYKWIEKSRRNVISLIELQHLSCLITLEIHIPNVEAIPKDKLFFGRLERYKISIGDDMWYRQDDRMKKTSRMLKLQMNKSICLVDEIKLLLGKTQSLCLDKMGDVEILQMLDHHNVESFRQLRFIEVKSCNMLKKLFSFTIAKRLCQLEELDVSYCDNLTKLIEEKEEIGESDILKFNKLRILRLFKLKRFSGLWYSEETSQSSANLFDKKVKFPVLEKLSILYMNNLERLWDDQLVEHSFSKLTYIELSNCPKLLNVIPLSMLPRLQRLDKLRIGCCESVEEIISEGDSNNSSSKMSSLSPCFIQSDISSFEFSNLTYLELYYLQNLKSIHHNKMHTINWPSLKEMRVEKCHVVEILFAVSQETSSQQPLFWVNEFTFPNLQQLTLGWNAGMKDIIWHCNSQHQQQLLSLYFPNLKVVTLLNYPKEVTVLPSYLFPLLSLPNLQKLRIFSSSFKEMIFQSEEGVEEKPASLLLSQITKLKLEYLYELMHLWKEKEGFPILRILVVSNCHKLKANLFPSSVSFLNLVTLEVYECHGIIKLITHSTAKSLVQLKEMSIEKCENIEEIVQGRDDDDEISFPQINRLELVDLPKLESFCSSDKYTFGFPSLEVLDVDGCPKMKKFSEGHSNTPMLHKVQLDWFDEEGL